VFELWLGNAHGLELEFYDGLLSSLDVAVLTPVAAQRAGYWLRLLPREQQPRLSRDALIAASADHRDEVVITRNTRDFRLFSVRLAEY
jgi:predicted nucleic acid-binding protein